MTNEELHEHFVYEADTGLLRRIKGGRKPYPWRPIGNKGAYLCTTFQGLTYYLHRLVWQYHHGSIPKMVDHRDGDTRNNRVENLRECTNAQNQYNSARKVTNRMGAKGVVFHPLCKSRPFQAKIAKAGRVISLGYYATVEEASAAYARGATAVAADFARVE